MTLPSETASPEPSRGVVRRVQSSLAAIVVLIVAISGCGSARADDSARRLDGGVHDAASEQRSPEENPISLTLWPFWGVPVDENGFGEPEPLADVTVCVARKRGYEDPWDSFVETKGPCEKFTAPNEKVVLSGVPAMSELILTANKPGYIPRAFPVVTGQSDQDATGGLDLKQMQLFRLDALAHLFPGADVRQGLLSVFALSADFSGAGDSYVSWFLGGVTVTLDPAGDEPFYVHGGVVAVGATETAPGGLSTLDDYSFAGFANLSAREYFVHADHANAVCNALVTGGDAIWGYPASLGVIRAPVLAGYHAMVGATCGCSLPSDPGTCTPTSDDAGVP